MDNLEKKEKTAEDVLIADEDLALVSGGGEPFNKPCPVCGQMTLVKSGCFVGCKRSGCTFIMRVPG